MLGESNISVQCEDEYFWMSVKEKLLLNVMALWLCLHGGLQGIPGGNIVNTCHVYGVII